MNTPKDTLGVTIAIGDQAVITAYGWSVRLIDTNKTVTVTGFTRSGNVQHNGGDNSHDPVANGKAIRPGCIAVSRRDGGFGLEGNRE